MSRVFCFLESSIVQSGLCRLFFYADCPKKNTNPIYEKVDNGVALISSQLSFSSLSSSHVCSSINFPSKPAWEGTEKVRLI